MLHLSGILWDRVADIAVHTASAASLEMDEQANRGGPARLNQNAATIGCTGITEPPVLTGGDGILASFLSPLHRGTRPQRLQLLFCPLMSPDSLSRSWLHAAGGYQFAGASTEMVAVMSLTHYHYYGNAFCLDVRLMTAAATATKAAAKVCGEPRSQ
jgi:hypothetical protein